MARNSLKKTHRRKLQLRRRSFTYEEKKAAVGIAAAEGNDEAVRRVWGDVQGKKLESCRRIIRRWRGESTRIFGLNTTSLRRRKSRPLGVSLLSWKKYGNMEKIRTHLRGGKRKETEFYQSTHAHHSPL